MKQETKSCSGHVPSYVLPYLPPLADFFADAGFLKGPFAGLLRTTSSGSCASLLSPSSSSSSPSGREACSLEGHSSSCFLPLPLAFGFAPAFPLGLAVCGLAAASEDVSSGEYLPRPELLAAGVAGAFAEALAAAPLWDHAHKKKNLTIQICSVSVLGERLFIWFWNRFNLEV